MKFTIIISKQDLAGLNILEKLNHKAISEIKNTSVLVIKEDSVEFSEKIETDFIIFATRHQSKSGEKTL
jgi:D-tyrosyl-tRNA(Tyr) deacylase